MRHSDATRKRSKHHRHEDTEEGKKADPSADALSALEAHFAAQFDVPVMREFSAAQKGKAKRVTEVNDLFEDREQTQEQVHQDRITGSASIKMKKQSSVVPQTIFFGESSNGGGGAASSEGSSKWKQFMSSKVTTRTDLEKEALLSTKRGKASKSKRGNTGGALEGEENDDEEDEKQAQSNDRELSELLGTTLFAPGGIGTKTIRSNGRPILGSNDTLARLLELSKHNVTGKAQSQGRGLGAAMVKTQEMSKMPANIRHGMRRVEMEKQDRKLQKQKELGNYHHSIKDLLNKKEGLDLILGTKGSDRSKRKRDKGIGMGIGKFQGGMLKLSDQEVDRINRPLNQSRNKRRKS